MIDTLFRILANPWYKYIVLTFAATLLAIVVRVLCRKEVRVELEDWAVGLDLAQVSIFILLTDGVADVVREILVNKAPTVPAALAMRLALLGPILFWMFLFLVVAVLLVRGYGWLPLAAPGACAHLNKKGIFGPLPLGLLYLAVVMLYLGGH